MMPGTDQAAVPDPSRGLWVEGLRKSYSNRLVLRDVSLRLDRGEPIAAFFVQAWRFS